MERTELEELWQRKKLQTLRLTEAAELTQQLARALDRRDEVSVRMILSMREEPLRRLQELDESLRQYLIHLPETSAVRAKELLNGSPAQNAAEIRLQDQVAQFRRTLASTVELDRRLSLRMGEKRSFYNMYR